MNIQKKQTVGFNDIYDTLKKYFVYRTGAIEADGSGAPGPALAALETPEETLHSGVQDTAT